MASMAEAAPPPAKRARLAAPAARPDRILVPHDQEQAQPGQAHKGFRVTADEFDGLQTLAAMPEHEPRPRNSVTVHGHALRARPTGWHRAAAGRRRFRCGRRPWDADACHRGVRLPRGCCAAGAGAGRRRHLRAVAAARCSGSGSDGSDGGGGGQSGSGGGCGGGCGECGGGCGECGKGCDGGGQGVRGGGGARPKRPSKR